MDSPGSEGKYDHPHYQERQPPSDSRDDGGGNWCGHYRGIYGDVGHGRILCNVSH